jgi:sugar O-acyltransferase (sialic acid O-acetyltransferase NeuD family)
MEKSKKLVIIGDSAFAEVAYEYFTHDSEYVVVGFAVEYEYRKNTELFGLPVVDFESIEKKYSPHDHWIYVALVYTQLNRARARLVESAKNKGYRLASYISSRAFIWNNVEIGGHCFIFEDNTVQPFVKLGNNVVLWSGNHIGHHSRIGDHVFVSSHVVISGFVEVGEYCFLGVNSTISNNISIARDCWIGPQVVITKNTEPGAFYKPAPDEPAKITTYRYFKVKE